MLGYNIIVTSEYQYHISLICRLLSIKNISVIKSDLISSTYKTNINYDKLRNYIIKTQNIDIIPNGIQNFFRRYCYFYKKVPNYNTVNIIYEIEFLKIIEEIIDIYPDPCNKLFIEWCFKYFYNIEASIDEIEYHVNNNKNVDLLEWLFTIYFCEESRNSGLIRVFENVPVDNKRIAVIFCGHTRKLEKVINTHKQIIFHPNYEIFIHTWDNTGTKSRNLWYKHWLLPDIDQENITEEFVKNSYKSIDIIMENNSLLLNSMSFVDKINPLFLFESQARDDASKYINSQLYSIYKAYTLVKKHEEETGKLFDGLIKLRFDMVISSLNLKNIILDIPNTAVYFAAASCCNHGHFKGGGGCLSCDNEGHFKLHDKHTNDICDILFYTNRILMEYTCNIYNNALDILRKNLRRNMELLSTLPHERDKNFIYIKGNNIEGEVVCFYPERMLREHLEQYHCKSSHNIKGHIYDSSV
jgi:hypothetical protein